jgi:hypothetical protein
MLTLRRLLFASLCVGVLAFGFFVINNECAYGGGMGAAYKDCDCWGSEVQLLDQTQADGPRKTICIGVITKTTCYEYMGGPERPCEHE